MQQLRHETISFAGFTLDLTRSCLWHGSQEVKLRPKSFDVLRHLVENNGRLVSKGELLGAVWPSTAITDDSLVQCLIEIRRALGEQQLVRTIPRRGYIFDAEIKTDESNANSISNIDEVSTEEKPLLVSASGPSLKLLSRHAERSPQWLMRLVVGVVVAVAGLSVFTIYRDRAVTQTSTTPIRSIAVLPLKNLSDDPANEYFSDGMTDSLISALSEITDLKVSSRSSLNRFNGKELDPREVGRQLGVAAVLEGSVRKSSTSVRVAVRLVSVEDGRVLWSRDTNERALGDVFALQDEIARNVADGLKLNLSGDRAEKISRRYPNSVEAYQLYLKGRYFWNKRTEESLLKSVEYFQQAIAMDQDYAMAYVGLADSYLVLKSLSLITAKEAHLRVGDALQRALEIDDRLGEAHKSLAWVRFAYDWKWSEAETEFKRAIELQSNDATTHQWYAEFLSSMGRVDESLAEIRRAQQLEPASPIINVIAAQIYFFGRQYDQAIEQCHKTLELDPNFYIAHDYLGWSYEKKGMYEEAIAALKKARQIENTPLQLCELGTAYAGSGNKEGARMVIREIVEGSDRRLAPRHSYRLARIYSALHEAGPAFEWLEKAFNEREENLVWLKVDPHLDNLRSDPRFSDVMRRIGF
jgi:TolB-like protein/DNA-binding winged helix-turn-helix (wHTH) protein/Tfp pilus assembly protein PilF